jgi:hypothetical protein
MRSLVHFHFAGIHRFLASLLLGMLVVTTPAASQTVGADDVAKTIKSLEGVFSLKSTGTQSQRRLAAIENSIGDLRALQGPDLGVFVPKDMLVQLARQALKKSQGSIRSALPDLDMTWIDPQIEVGEQELSARLAADFSFQKMGISGAINLTTYFALSGGPGLVELSPTIGSVAFSKLNFTTQAPISLPIDAIKDALNEVLKTLVSQIDGHLLPIRITIPDIDPIQIDFAAASKSVAGLTVTPPTFTAPAAKTGGVAFLVTPQGLFAAMDVVITSVPRGAQPLALATPPAGPEYEFLRKSFASIWLEKFGEDTSDAKNAVALLSSGRLADYINTSWALASPAAGLVFQEFRQNFPGTDIRLAESPSYSCRSGRQCTVGACSRPPGRCAWSCTVSGPNVPCPTFSNPFRTCPTSFDEPGCLTTRTACNVKEEAQVARCVADQAAQKLDCERLKGQENLGCEIGKGLVDGLARLGPIGRVGGDVNASGSAQLASTGLKIGDDFSTVSTSWNLSASAAIKLGVDFVPLNVGHVLTCPFPGKVFYQGTVQLPAQSKSINARLKQVAAEGDLLAALALDVDEFSIDLKVSPPPLEGLIAQNPQLAFVCNPVLGGAAVGLSILGKARVVVGDEAVRRAAGNEVGGLLTGVYTYKVGSMSFPLRMKPVQIALDNQVYNGSGKLGPKALRFELSPSK